MKNKQNLQMDFSHKTVWVTGAARGIGEQIARDFTALGANVIGFDRVFEQDNLPYKCIQLDISDPEKVEMICSQQLAISAKLDVLVNAAGILQLGNIDELNISDWHRCINVNASGAFYLFRSVIPHFKRQRSGNIISVSSNAAHVPRMRMAAYCASKSALTSLTHCVGLELAPFGVRCNVVSPGSTDTLMQRSMWKTDDDEKNTINGYPEQYKLGIPLGKIANVNEISHTVLFLSSDLASHITLQDIVVDGGATLAC
ncbi:2,3-dihydroxybenzoate-2,3-dehydrogenase [Photorhabdus luminescens subsp. luminescens]|uniref:2,3-dihydro-2,3-dihydroxybenzoate dehydrogenase n=1 Tax=Photorhabdus luminescens TaxID=29488 RepID=A0A1G5Q730_PHOLU|nr:2,3-dihydro-2,3-dihydroxybenzoate dehydrogenase [Photorhabdus luminescens]KMW74308.1 2,3-dihydroxybenzoate-2,3-dehydrogenase [Photorhabdus luminescens subsp. luminescens]SCZ57428.1 2,3-dihydro-2,3-dihydroxybenzoate dehydrogenase [Photorhabdus luminescens]